MKIIDTSIVTHLGLSLKSMQDLILKNNIFYRKLKDLMVILLKISEFTGMERTALYRKFKSLDINITITNK